jgi:hypothetical protein
MKMTAQDKQVLRGLAERYSAIAHQPIQQERLTRYVKTISREPVRPVVLIFEVPWGEIRDEALACRCVKELHWLEAPLRQTLYQWEHFQADHVIRPEFRVAKRVHNTGIGLDVQEQQIGTQTGTDIRAHEYHDQLQAEADLDKLKLPVISYDKAATDAAVAVAGEVFAGLLPVKATGGPYLAYSLWDTVARYRGVDALLLDLAERPEFMHQTVQRFAAIAEATFRQIIEQDLVETDPLYVHCTVGPTRDLPAADFDGKVRPKDVWGRCAAQIFGSVSPAMHDEFDLAYNAKLFAGCDLVYYGCCEPMDRKVDILRKRFKNLRKISITPWADPERAAANIGKDYVLAAKPSPAHVSQPMFHPEIVEKEITGYVEACRRHGTTCEFVLKDISTIANNPRHLTQWAATVKRVLDQHYE